MVEYSEEQLQRGTAENLRRSWSGSHKIIQLYAMAEDCPHTNPYDDEKYDSVDELIDAWMARNCAGLSYDDTRPLLKVGYEFVWKNRKRAEWSVPLSVEYILAEREYSALHSNVCLDTPMGSCCTECAEGDEDWGFEPGPCNRQHDARARQSEFFDLFTQDNFDLMEKTK